MRVKKETTVPRRRRPQNGSKLTSSMFFAPRDKKQYSPHGQKYGVNFSPHSGTLKPWYNHFHFIPWFSPSAAPRDENPGMKWQ